MYTNEVKILLITQGHHVFIISIILIVCLQCSRSCDRGEKFRLVQCVDVMSDSLQVVSEHLCSGSKKPLPNKTCIKQPCPFVWKVADWSMVCIFAHKHPYVDNNNYRKGVLNFVLKLVSVISNI